jgi:hypothetical protein
MRYIVFLIFAICLKLNADIPTLDTIVKKRMTQSDSAIVFNPNSTLFFTMKTLLFTTTLDLGYLSLGSLRVCYNLNPYFLLNVKILNSNVKSPDLFIFEFQDVYDIRVLKSNETNNIINIPDSVWKLGFHRCPIFSRRIIAYNIKTNRFYRLRGFYDNDIYDFYLDYYANGSKKSKYPKIARDRQKKEIMKSVLIETYPLKGVLKEMFLIRKYCHFTSHGNGC